MHNLTSMSNDGLSVGFAAVLDCGDRDRVLIFEIEEHAVVAAAEAESSERILELHHIEGAAGEVTIHSVKNLQGGLAVDGAQISASLRRPDRCDPCGR